MVRWLKELSESILRKIFELGQRFGINILPCYFYSEIPNIQEMKSNKYWKDPYSMIGVNGTNIDDQLKFIEYCCSNELIERQKHRDIYKTCCTVSGEGGGYGPIESDFLFCFISKRRPKKIVQVGCGISTAVILLASSEARYLPEIVCVDPYPTNFLVKIAKENKIKLIPDKAQLVDINLLTNLNDDGFLFIDSTHTVKPGSEVNRLILEILPRLKKGNFVHFHDITFPYDYPRQIMTSELFFSNESVLLHSYLINNCKCVLRASLSMLHYSCPLRLKKYLPNYSPSINDCGLELLPGHFPSSVYLEVTA